MDHDLSRMDHKILYLIHKILYGSIWIRYINHMEHGPELSHVPQTFCLNSC